MRQERRARQEGIADTSLIEVDDADDPREAAITLIMETTWPKLSQEGGTKTTRLLITPLPPRYNKKRTIEFQRDWDPTYMIDYYVNLATLEAFWEVPDGINVQI